MCVFCILYMPSCLCSDVTLSCTVCRTLSHKNNVISRLWVWHNSLRAVSRRGTPLSSYLFNFFIICSVTLSLPVIISFRSDGKTTSEKTEEKKVQKCTSVSPSSAPAGFYAEFERKQEKRLPRLHSSSLPFHPLTSVHSKIFFHSAVFSR